jgi:hypothetical protein
MRKYVLEPTGADSLSQNGAVEIYNNKLAIRARTFLYGLGLAAKYWSTALLHLVYLHNRLVLSVTKKTPFKGFHGMKPNLSPLKLFGLRVCIKRTGSRRGKLNKHNFKGIFLGYMATNQNIVFLDLDSGLIQQSHHVQFDEAWYLQASRPPASQLLYNLGMKPDNLDTADTASDTSTAETDFCLPGTIKPVQIPWPPMMTAQVNTAPWKVPDKCTVLSLPLRHMGMSSGPSHTISAQAACTRLPPHPTQ